MLETGSLVAPGTSEDGAKSPFAKPPSFAKASADKPKDDSSWPTEAGPTDCCSSAIDETFFSPTAGVNALFRRVAPESVSSAD